MKFRIVVPAIFISVTILTGVAVVAWVAVSGLAAEEPVPRIDRRPAPSTPAPPARVLTPLPLTQPELVDKSPEPDEATQLPTRAERLSSIQADDRTVYTWRDGDRTERVVLLADLTVQETISNKPEDVVVVEGLKTNIIEKRPVHGPDAQPVFRSESSGGLMTLPGGVLLGLDPEWSEEQVAEFFFRNNIPEGRRSEIGFLINGFVVETEPGFLSLELANELADQPGVVMSSPNWQRELETR